MEFNVLIIIEKQEGHKGRDVVWLAGGKSTARKRQW